MEPARKALRREVIRWLQCVKLFATVIGLCHPSICQILELAPLSIVQICFHEEEPSWESFWNTEVKVPVRGPDHNQPPNPLSWDSFREAFQFLLVC